MKSTKSNDAGLLLTITAAAKRLGLSRTKFYELLESGQIAYRRLGPGGERRIPAAELERFAHDELVRAN
jgi:excisionase family DNA binding protein